MQKEGINLMSTQTAEDRLSNPAHVLRLHSSIFLRLILVGWVALAAATAMAETPGTGSEAPDFSLPTPTGASVSLANETAKGTTVLVMLRGYPGYQCPYCVMQVHDFAEHSAGFAAKGVHVLFIYPGPPADLDLHVKEFLAKGAALPANVQVVIDPDYKVTKLYGLRWDAPHETAFPATFILDRSRKILFEKIVHTHGDRTKAEEVLALIPVK